MGYYLGECLIIMYLDRYFPKPLNLNNPFEGSFGVEFVSVVSEESPDERLVWVSQVTRTPRSQKVTWRGTKIRV